LARRYITELRTHRAVDELWKHGLLEDDVLEVSWDDPAFFRDRVDGRERMIGRTTGGRLLTIIIEPTAVDGTWDVVTGWDSDRGERTEWEKARPREVRRR
jgi:hypothetical protein